MDGWSVAEIVVYFDSAQSPQQKKELYVRDQIKQMNLLNKGIHKMLIPTKEAGAFVMVTGNSVQLSLIS